MKQILRSYLLIGLLLAAVVSVLSYGAGVGYVFIQWHGWQIQSNMWVLLFGLLLLSFALNMLWLALKRYLTRQQRKATEVLNFQNFHPYEQLGVIWLLDAATHQQTFVENVFAQSGLLKGVVDSKLSFMQGDHVEALKDLEQSAPIAFELAEIQRIEIYLAQQDAEQVLTHLEFIQQHQLSPWLQDVREAYEQKLLNLWGQFAVQHPWKYLHSSTYGHLPAQQKDQWLQQLLQQFDQASTDDLILLEQRYLDLADQLPSRSFSTQVLWLKVLVHMSNMDAHIEQFAARLLNDHFDREVFYLWLQQQLLKAQPNYAYIEEKIQLLENKYSALPVLLFAKWHVYTATNRPAEAEQLLQYYPDNILFNYLRIKSVLPSEDLQQQLNTLLEGDVNFLKMKI